MSHAHTLRYGAVLLAAFLIFALAASTASAFHSPEHYSLDGDASYASPGNASNRAVKLVSDSAPGYGAVEFGVETGTTYADLQNLGTDYMFESDDSCMGGSPRFQVNLEDPNSDDEGNLFVYLGSAPHYTNCAAGVWQTTGDLLAGTIDSSQLDGGAFYDPYAATVAKYGDYVVTGIQLVTDAGWAAGDSEQAVTVDNTVINGTTFSFERPTPTIKDQCKNGGWRDMADSNGNSFKNQGQCVSSVNRN